MAKGINIFDSAKGKPKPSSSAKDKPTVEVDGIEAQLNELQNLKTQIANLETELDVVTDEIKTIAKEKFVELYLENGRNPNTFLLKDGSGCVMVIPTDKYISIKDEDRANQLIETYGEDIVTIDEKYYFNPEVLERNMKAIEKLIRDAKSISDADKQNLLIREVKYSVTKGTIDELYDYGEDMEAVINDIQPIITLKNCGGKMAEGGTDGEFIANVYADGGMTENTFDNIFLMDGFKKVKNFGGVRFFQKGDIFASVDDKNRIVEITRREGQGIYRGYRVLDVIDVIVNKFFYQNNDTEGIMSFYEKILIHNGFKKENNPNAYGSSVHYSKGDITAHINKDEISLFNGEGESKYFGYFNQKPFANPDELIEELDYMSPRHLHKYMNIKYLPYANST